MRPPEIGHAAAYEAYRTWVQNSGTYSHLSGSSHNQREALVGLAVAEASRLLSLTDHHPDHYASIAASEAAAATVSFIFQNQGNIHHGHRRSRSYSRSRYGSGSSLGDSSSDDGFHRFNSHHRSHSRHRPRSRRPSFQGANSIGYPGSSYVPSSHAHSGTHASTYNYGMSPSYAPLGTENMVTQPVHGTPYPSAPLPLTPSANFSHYSSSFAVPDGTSAYGYPMTYTSTPYVGQAVSANGMMLAPPTIVIHKKSKHKHHKHRSRSRTKRSRSVDHHHHHHRKY